MTAHQSFLQSLHACQNDLRAFIGSLVTDPTRREDVFQETALTLWQKYDTYDPCHPFGAWARGVAAKKILQLKRNDRRFPMPFEPDVVNALADTFEATEREREPTLEERALRHCLKKLPATQFNLIAAHYEGRQSGKAMARKRGQSVDAIYQQLSRIRKRLGRCIEAYRRHMTSP